MNRAPTRPPRLAQFPLAAHAAGGFSSSSRARRSFDRRARAVLGIAALALALSSACGEDAQGPPLVADAGPACERGTRNCACIGGSGCQDDLFCIAGMCSTPLDEGPTEMLPRPRPPLAPPGPAAPERDSGSPPPSGDAGSLPPGDAGAPSTGAPDASVSG